MTADMTPWPGAQRLTGDSLQRVRFNRAERSGRGYDEAEVDALIAQCANELEMLGRRIQALEAENQRFQQPGNARRGDDVLRSVSVLVQAQRTADTTVAQADEYSARVMYEARTLYENARHRAAEMVDEAHRAAVQAAAEKGEVDREATYLRTLRDVTRTQIETFLEGLLDHLTSEYGRATAGAAEAAAALDKPPGHATTERPDLGPAARA